MWIRLCALHGRRLGLVGRSSELHPAISDSAGFLGLVDAIGQSGLVAFTTSDSLQVVEVYPFADGDGEVVAVRIADRLEERARVGDLSSAISPMAGQSQRERFLASWPMPGRK